MPIDRQYPPDRFTRVQEIWNGSHAEDGESCPWAMRSLRGFQSLEEEPEFSAPGAIDSEMFRQFTKKLA